MQTDLVKDTAAMLAASAALSVSSQSSQGKDAGDSSSSEEEQERDDSVIPSSGMDRVDAILADVFSQTPAAACTVSPRVAQAHTEWVAAQAALSSHPWEAHDPGELAHAFAQGTQADHAAASSASPRVAQAHTEWVAALPRTAEELFKRRLATTDGEFWLRHGLFPFRAWCTPGSWVPERGGDDGAAAVPADAEISLAINFMSGGKAVEVTLPRASTFQVCSSPRPQPLL